MTGCRTPRCSRTGSWRICERMKLLIGPQMWWTSFFSVAQNASIAALSNAVAAWVAGRPGLESIGAHWSSSIRRRSPDQVEGPRLEP